LSSISTKPEFKDLQGLHQFLSQYLKIRKIPSLVVVALKRARIVWQGFYGYANVSARMPPNFETVYCWYSLTKLITAFAIMMLSEKEKLTLDSLVGDYLPYFAPEYSGMKVKVTVRHLLTHSSGLGDKEWHAARWYRLATEPEPDPEAWLKHQLSKYHKLKSEPGERFSYSNLGYAVLGDLIAKVSGKSYKEYVKENILGPLGMARTGFDITGEMGSNVAVGYEKPWSLNAMLLRLIGGGKALGKKEDDFVSVKRLYVKDPSYAGLWAALVT
jgi:CubicO group peptidase (beta-lactamase class C family)